VKHGEMILISDLPESCDGSWDGRSVRITGNLGARNNKADTVEVTHKGHTISVTTKLLGTKQNEADSRPFSYKKGDLWQFIGEIQETQLSAAASSSSSSSSSMSASTHERVLTARVASNVTGMNMTLFERALQVQRNFMKCLKNVDGASSAENNSAKKKKQKITK